MARRLNASSPGFVAAFAELLQAREEEGRDVSAAVSAIIADIRSGGDEALLRYTRRFDWAECPENALKLTQADIAETAARCPAPVKEALAFAARRIRSYHERQLPQDVRYTDDTGVTLGWRWTPVDAAGLYVPGGLATYPSSVLMNAVPAQVAGVKRLVMVVPTPQGALNPAVLAAAQLAGIEEIYRVGGAQAVAALAYGTETIPPVAKIVGPGNAYVAEAKRQVYGRVGIDMIAGPSEILVVADNRNDPRWIAADLLSQAEHDRAAQSILITDDAAFADKVEKEIGTLLETLPRAAIAGASWRDHGAVILVSRLEEAPGLVDALAPEHLELAVDAPEELARVIRHAGAIFLGRHTPEAIGDYVAGPSHVLPTSRTAAFSSGLSVLDFMKRTSLIGCTPQAANAIGGAGERLAEAEGLQAHGLSIALRREP